MHYCSHVATKVASITLRSCFAGRPRLSSVCAHSAAQEPPWFVAVSEMSVLCFVLARERVCP